MQIWILDLVSRSWTFSEIYCFYTQDELSNYFRLFVADPTNLDLRTALFVIEDLQFLYSDPHTIPVFGSAKICGSKYLDPSGKISNKNLILATLIWTAEKRDQNFRIFTLPAMTNRCQLWSLGFQGLGGKF